MSASDMQTIPTFATVGALSRRKRTNRPLPRALTLTLAEATDTLSPEQSTQESLRETSMDLGGAVIFCVNPPASPQSSDTYSEDHDAFHRSWCTGYGNSTLTLPSTSKVSLVDRGLAPSISPSGTEALKNTVVGPTEDQASLNRRPQGSRRSSLIENSRKSELYKTELCVSLTSGLPCKYGDQCQFAHSRQELQIVARHPRYKTQLCTSYQTFSYCKYNDRCTFVHRLEESRVPLSILFENSPKQAPRMRANSVPLTEQTTNLSEPQSSPPRVPKSETVFSRTQQAKSINVDKCPARLGEDIHPWAALPLSNNKAQVAAVRPQVQRQYQHHLRSSSVPDWHSLSTLINNGQINIGQGPQTFYALPAQNAQSQAKKVTFDEACKPMWNSPQHGFTEWGHDDCGMNEIEWASQLARFIWTPQNEFHI